MKEVQSQNGGNLTNPSTLCETHTFDGKESQSDGKYKLRLNQGSPSRIIDESVYVGSGQAALMDKEELRCEDEMESEPTDEERGESVQSTVVREVNQVEGEEESLLGLPYKRLKSVIASGRRKQPVRAAEYPEKLSENGNSEEESRSSGESSSSDSEREYRR